MKYLFDSLCSHILTHVHVRPQPRPRTVPRGRVSDHPSVVSKQVSSKRADEHQLVRDLICFRHRLRLFATRYYLLVG